MLQEHSHDLNKEAVHQKTRGASSHSFSVIWQTKEQFKEPDVWLEAQNLS